MGIYLEQGSYVRAKILLDEDFQARASRGDASLRTYFATAGQALNGARLHIARYRSYGINVTDAVLPAEAVNDLDRLGAFLERLAFQARQIAQQRKTYDALELLEDALGVRLSLSRDTEDRAKWDAEYASAREALASTQIASLGGTPPLQRNAVQAKTSPPAKELPPTAVEPNPAMPSANTVTAASQPTPAPTPTATTQPAPASEEKSSAAGTGAASGDEPRTISTGSLNTRATKRVVPTYPPLAKSSGTQGVVRVRVLVDEAGKVIEVSSSEGPSLLRPSAEQAARGWRFQPTAIGGKPVRLTGYIEFTFTL
jgi:periplasmic protein TonB